MNENNINYNASYNVGYENFGKIEGVFDYYTTKWKMNSGLTKCGRELYTKLYDAIAAGCFAMGFIFFIIVIASGGIASSMRAVTGAIMLIFWAAFIVAAVEHRIKSIDFATYQARITSQAPKKKFAVRVTLYETGVFFAVTPNLTGYMPYFNDFKFVEKKKYFFLGSMSTKSFLAIQKSQLSEEAMMILRSASPTIHNS
jgi:hypothetical protein